MYPQPMNKDSSPQHPTANQLENAASSYLRSARHQPVQWHAWGEAAFARAREEDKPILLDIGAVWCHWCHVMDRESYENPELAAIINEHFVAIKVDRDERPDVDARYQAAVSAISGQGGWPLTAFLTPDGRPYFGGTYFPCDERYGRPGFGRVLLTMATVWQQRRDEALESAASVMAAIEHNESFSGGNGSLTLALAEKIADSARKQFDRRNGGFGSQPKFPHPGTLDLLLQIASRLSKDRSEAAQSKAASLLEAAVITLEKMAQGGIYDQLAGGFHRYSVDDHWAVPHFEKMLYDNTELLRNYVHASRFRSEFVPIAREIMGWLDSTMTERERGGFYASQDADIHLDDDGDYFTWTVDEARSALDAKEFSFAAQYWDINELGDMHHNPAKNVLHVKSTMEPFASQADCTVDEVLALRDRVRGKLLAARNTRSTPFIDRTLYTGWNAMAITAYFEAARALSLKDAREFAALSLDRLLAEAWNGADDLFHVIAYAEDIAPAERVAGTLDDYAFSVHACIDGWQSTGRMKYFHAAESLANAMIARFYDRVAGAFYDTAAILPGEQQLGVLAARRKPLQDSPTPSGNSTAASALLRLEALNGSSEYRMIAEDTLGSFAGIVEHFGLYVGSYGLALERLMLDPVQVVIVGTGPDVDRLEAVTTESFAINKTVIRLENLSDLPPLLAETLVHIPMQGSAWALVCKGKTCLPPIADAGQLRLLFE